MEVEPCEIRAYINSIDPKLNAIVTGSTALFFAMKAFGLEPNFRPKDIDIFYPQKTSIDLVAIVAWFRDTVEWNYCGCRYDE